MQIQENIYNFLQLIPKNKVVTYKDLSLLFWVSPRKIAYILSQNTRQDVPCYKVVHTNRNVWGYNLGVDEKIKRLQNDWIQLENKQIPTKYFWKIKIFNYFIAFPMNRKNKDFFENFQKELKFRIGKKNIIYQNPKTPHITIKFIWDMEPSKLPTLVSKLEEYFQKDFQLKWKTIPLDVFDSFDGRVYYITCSKVEKKLLKNYLKNFNHFLGLSRDKREREPHLTVFKYKWLKPLKQDKKIQSIFAKHDIWIDIDVVRVYAAVNWIYQIPLVDINLS